MRQNNYKNRYKTISINLKKNKFVRFILYPVLYLQKRVSKRIHDGLSSKFDIFLKKVDYGEILIHFEDFQGKFRVGIHSTLVKRILLYGEYEETLTHRVAKYLNKKKDVIDVGANIGLFTVLFSKTIENDNRVLAIEPTQNATKYLEENIRQNNCSEKVIIFNGVAADKPGGYVLNTIAGMEEYSSLGQLTHSDIIEKKSNLLAVPGQTIDTLVTKYSIQPGFIKIDTEGAELSVIKGAQQTITNFRPVILSEVSDRLLQVQGGSVKKLFELLHEHDYKLFNAYTMAPVCREFFDGDIIALPKHITAESSQ